MKYPKEQYGELKKTIGILGQHFEVGQINPSALHFSVFQQYSVGLSHNALVVVDGKVMQRYKLESIEHDPSEVKKLVTSDFEFRLYPEGCHDDHCETAVRKAIRELKAENVI